MDDDEQEVFDCMDRVCLSPPSPEGLEAAAEDVLGPGADEALLPAGAKVFRGGGGFFLQGLEDSAGEVLTAAPRVLQDQLMAEASKVRQMRAEIALADYRDPAKNPMIKLGDD